MLKSGIAIGIVIAALELAFWAGLGRPVAAPAAPATIGGFSFSPMHRGQDPNARQFPTLEQLEADLALIAPLTHRIRVYSLDGTLAAVPALARAHDLEVTTGIWLDRPDSANDRAANATRLETLTRVVATNENVTRAIVGNETLLDKGWSVAELASVLDRARGALDVPVGTAETWDVWLAHPELAEHVDFVAVHLLPYWEGVDVDAAVGHVAARIRDLERRFPGKPVVVDEVGWPSRGRMRGAAAASPLNAARFDRGFLNLAARNGYDYFLLEAFDQPWKRAEEGEVGAYWGLYDLDRLPKFALAGPLRPVAGWPMLAFVSAVAAIGVFAALTADSRRLGARGRWFLGAVAATSIPATVAALAGLAAQYWTLPSVLASAILLAGLAGVLLLVLVEAHEWAEAQWGRHRVDEPTRDIPATRAAPKVSVHVPAHEEPPELLAQTLAALAALEYPDFEVLVIDNNTADPRLWQPVAALCERLGPRFRFHHVAPLPGFKAGALNFALERTARDAEIVAVVDADYCVDPEWLGRLVGRFGDPNVAIVQAPQAYRDGNASTFKAVCDAEYRGFFSIGMVTRDNRNAIIQHGTMTMIRKSALLEVGGWAEWTITEDAELGLRLLEHGYEAVYTSECLGRGLTPDNFTDYKAQRFRWALGAVQILRRHAGMLLGLVPSRLTLGQRLHFLTGWLAWLGDGCNLLFNFVALAWSLLMIAAPLRFFPPLATFSAFVLALFAFKLAKVVVLYRRRVGAGIAATAGAVVGGLALVHVVGCAVLAGFKRRRAHFRRTPKLVGRDAPRGALEAVRSESLLATLLLLAAAGVAVTAPFPSIDRTLWCALLLVLATPYLAAVAVALGSALPRRSTRPLLLRLQNALETARRG